MASRIHRVWATCCRQTLLCLQNHWCQGETGSIWWNTALVLPLPFTKRREARKRKKKENWRETEREEAERSVKEERERDSTRWIMQSCQRRLLLEVLAVLKGEKPWSTPAPSTTLTTPHGEEPSDLCSGKWPTTRWGGARKGDGPGHLVTGGLSWRDTTATTSMLFITAIYRGHWQEICADLYSSSAEI